MEQIDTLISARWVIPIAPINQILEHYSVAIRDDRIVGLLPTEAATQQYQASEQVDLKDHVLMPGLINAHTHTPMNLFRGLADDLKLMDWLNNHVWPAEKNVINKQSIEDGCRLAIAEMLRGGTTCFNEMYFFPNETAHTAIGEGMRACIGHTIMNVPTGWAQNEEEYIKKAQEAYQSRPKHSLISWSIAPQGCYTNSDQSLTAAKDLADELGLPINMHVQETQDEIEIEIQNHAKRPLQRLHDLGLLSKKFIAVHMVHLTSEEITLIKEMGCQVVHCPESNLKLASGFAPITKMLDAGINVALGTDGAASNNDLDMFSELRTAAFIAKAINHDSTALPAHQALEMATINGAKAIGLDHDIGSIELGKAADIIAINLNHLFTQPIYNPISHLAYAVNRLQVSDVWIAGNQLLKNGEFTQLDIDRTLANIQQWATKSEPFKSKASTVNEITA